jgi:hypothetical protein
MSISPPTPAAGPRAAMSCRVVTASFPSRAVAERVSAELERLGISPDNIRLVEDAPNPASVTAAEDTGWSALADSTPHDETEEQLAKGIPEGAFVVGVEIETDRLEAVMKLFTELGGVAIKSSTRR